MIHGLMWFPLLAVFIALAWAGWNEYQKVETYRLWAMGAERAKYDIRAAVIQKNRTLIWGTPSREGILSQQTLSLDTIKSVDVHVDGAVVAFDNPPHKGSSVILKLGDAGEAPKAIPFTDIDLAIQWAVALRNDIGVS